MMPPCGTFDYVATVPSYPYSSGWDLRLREPVQQTGDEVVDKRLVGYAPKLQISDMGLRPDTPDWQGQPSVMLVKILLTADRRQFATAASFSFYLDRAVIGALRPGDHFHLARSGGGGVGVSAIRDRQLIFAVGAVGTVPLGDYVKASVPYELMLKAEAIIRKQDPDFEFPEYPLGIQIGREMRIRYKGSMEMKGYQVFVWHGLQDSPDGYQECAAVSLNGSCSAAAANASAELLDHGGKCHLVGW